MAILNERKNKVIVERLLNEISPGVTVQTVDPDGSTGFYKVCKIGNTNIPKDMSGRILVMNLATGRLIHKKGDNLVQIVRESITITDPTEKWV